ncbi:MAG: hypothetical protein QW687_00540 [Candidatus Hadarchaeales archaeon]
MPVHPFFLAATAGAFVWIRVFRTFVTTVFTPHVVSSPAFVHPAPERLRHEIYFLSADGTDIHPLDLAAVLFRKNFPEIFASFPSPFPPPEIKIRAMRTAVTVFPTVYFPGFYPRHGSPPS